MCVPDPSAYVVAGSVCRLIKISLSLYWKNNQNTRAKAWLLVPAPGSSADFSEIPLLYKKNTCFPQRNLLIYICCFSLRTFWVSQRRCRILWQNVISAGRVLPSVFRYPTLTDVPIGLGRRTSSASKRLWMVPRREFTPAPVACVPARSPVPCNESED